MTPQFRILTGSQAGRAYIPTRDSFVAGRHTDADLRFDPDQDLAVSGKHARFVLRDGRWFVQDLSSLNGTFVNGRQVVGEVQLGDRDRIVFGAGGPAVEVSFEDGGLAFSESTTQRVRARVRRETRRLRWAAGAMTLIFLGLLAGELAVDRRQRSAWAHERSRLQQRIDSLLGTGTHASAPDLEVVGLRAALGRSEQRLRGLRAQLGRTEAGGDDAEMLKRQLLSTTAALRRQQLAADLDYAAIQRRSRGAVAMLWVEYTDGTRASGTAFAVQADGVLLTNRHLIIGADSRQHVRRAAVRFADSEQAFPARVIGVSEQWDLAAVHVENVIGNVPSIAVGDESARAIAAGAPVALIGFPYGGEPEKDPLANADVARPVVSAGIVMQSTPTVLQIQGMGAAGASGSPILDEKGTLVGILFGGRMDVEGNVLLAVPVRAVRRFLSTIDAAHAGS